MNRKTTSPMDKHVFTCGRVLYFFVGHITCLSLTAATFFPEHSIFKQENKERKVHGRLNASWKISCLAVNGQSFLVIDGYLLNLFSCLLTVYKQECIDRWQLLRFKRIKICLIDSDNIFLVNVRRNQSWDFHFLEALDARCHRFFSYGQWPLKRENNSEHTATAQKKRNIKLVNIMIGDEDIFMSPQ